MLVENLKKISYHLCELVEAKTIGRIKFSSLTAVLPFLGQTIYAQHNHLYLVTSDQKVIVAQRSDLFQLKVLHSFLADYNNTAAACISVNQHPWCSKKYVATMLYDMGQFKPTIRNDKKMTRKLLLQVFKKKLSDLEKKKKSTTDFVSHFKLLVSCKSLQLKQEKIEALQDYLRYDCLMRFGDYKKLIKIREKIPRAFLEDVIVTFKGITQDKKGVPLKTDFVSLNNASKNLNKKTLITLFYCLKKRSDTYYLDDQIYLYKSSCCFCRSGSDYAKIFNKLPEGLQKIVQNYQPLV